MIYQKKICLLSLVLMTFLTISCGREELSAPTVFNASDLSDVSYNFVGLNDKETVVILGQLNFVKSEGVNISGTWSLETWGEQPLFPHLPAGGSFSGLIHGELAIIAIDFPGTEESLGLIVEGFKEDKLLGTLKLLPESQFNGRFEAIRK